MIGVKHNIVDLRRSPTSYASEPVTTENPKTKARSDILAILFLANRLSQGWQRRRLFPFL